MRVDAIAGRLAWLDGAMTEHSHGHQHGNEHDRGVKAMVRYARYARLMWRSELNDAVVDLVAPLPGERVVDVGAGAGAATVVAAKRGASVMAVEPTPYMRRVLSGRRLAQRNRAQIRIVDGAAEATGLPDASADAAWAVNTMHHWTDMPAGARELARILAPGGRVVLVDEDFDDPAHPDHERFGGGHGDGDGEGDHAFHMVDADSVASELRAAGLEVSQAGKDDVADRPAIVVKASKPD